MKERLQDASLNIKTEEQKGFSSSIHYHRYEPTPYDALDELFKKYELKSSDQLVDFGCGKGRLNFYIHHKFDATVTGIEMNEMFHREAMENLKRYARKAKKKTEKIQFKCCLAEEYEIQPKENIFYFFNPFSVQVFMKVIQNILISAEQSARTIDIILYYPSDDYIYYLENQTAFVLIEEVDLPEYAHNPYERFLVYRLA